MASPLTRCPWPWGQAPRLGCWHWESLGSSASWTSSLPIIWVTDTETVLGLIMAQEQTLSQLIPIMLQWSRTEHFTVEEHVPWRAQSDNFQDGRNIFPGHILLGILKPSPLECTEYVLGSEVKPASTHPKAHFQPLTAFRLSASDHPSPHETT